MSKPIICLDFDGVIHSYISGWKGATVIPDPIVPGFFEWLAEVSKHFDVQIYSSRSNHPGGIEAMKDYLAEQYRHWSDGNEAEGYRISFATEKPPAFLTIDDRALTFTGTWPPLNTLRSFKPWNKP